jgi:hypothetical protein
VNRTSVQALAAVALILIGCALLHNASKTFDPQCSICYIGCSSRNR